MSNLSVFAYWLAGVLIASKCISMTIRNSFVSENKWCHQGVLPPTKSQEIFKSTLLHIKTQLIPISLPVHTN